MTKSGVSLWTRLKRRKNPLLLRLGMYRVPFPQEIRALNQDVDLSAHRFLFIGGLHRSGTSVIHRIVREHPLAAGIRNPRVPESEGQYLQDVFPPDRAFGGPGYFAFDPLCHLTEKSPLVSEANAHRLARQWCAYMDWRNARLLLEKSPSNLVRSRFLQALFPNSAFLFLARHPLAVSMATQKWARAPLSHLLDHWALAHRILSIDYPRLSTAWVFRYEDLARMGSEAADRLFSQLGMPKFCPSEEFVDFNQKYFDQIGPRERNRLWSSVSRETRETIENWGYSISNPDQITPPRPSPFPS